MAPLRRRDPTWRSEPAARSRGGGSGCPGDRLPGAGGGAVSPPRSASPPGVRQRNRLVRETAAAAQHDFHDPRAGDGPLRGPLPRGQPHHRRPSPRYVAHHLQGAPHGRHGPRRHPQHLWCVLSPKTGLFELSRKVTRAQVLNFSTGSP